MIRPYQIINRQNKKLTSVAFAVVNTPTFGFVHVGVNRKLIIRIPVVTTI